MDGLEGGAKVSPTLVPLDTKKELLSWAEKIKQHIPYSVMLYNSLMLHGGGYASQGRFYVLQGQPDTHAVVYWGTFQPKLQHITVFCTEEEADQLFEALRAAAFVNWGSSLLIHGVPRYLLDLMQKLTKEKGANMNMNPCVTFTYQPHLDTQPMRVGPGFRVCLLGKAGVHYLVQRAKYGGMAHLEMVSRLAQHVPFVGVYRDSGVTQDTTVDPNCLPVAGDEELPVAWVATTFQGAIGKLMTDEGYRRHGLGSLIVTVTARQQATLLKLIPHAFVETSNTASIAMFMGLPGWKLTHDVFWLLAGVTVQTPTGQTVSRL